MLQHEAALTKAEQTLEEDTAAFNKFLKESDEKVQQAMSRADTEMKAKQEKVRGLTLFLLHIIPHAKLAWRATIQGWCVTAWFEQCSNSSYEAPAMRHRPALVIDFPLQAARGWAPHSICHHG